MRTIRFSDAIGTVKMIGVINTLKASAGGSMDQKANSVIDSTAPADHAYEIKVCRSRYGEYSAPDRKKRFSQFSVTISTANDDTTQHSAKISREIHGNPKEAHLR